MFKLVWFDFHCLMVKNVLLKWYLTMIQVIKIRMIFYSKNWLWKSDLGTFWNSNRKNLELIFEQKSTHCIVDPCLQNSTTEVTLTKHYLFCLINIMKNFLNVVLFMDFLWALVHMLRPQPITWVSIGPEHT
jgi:hypothetical protein